MPTILNVTGATYPSTFHNGNKIHPLVGTDLMPAIKGKVSSIHEYMYWEHQGNRAVRWKNWKAVWDQEGKVWEKTFCRYLAGKTEQIIVWIARIKVYSFLYLENMDWEDRGFAVTQAGLFCQQHVFDDHSALWRGVGAVV